MSKTVIITIFLSIIVAVLASFFASSFPDGLEWVAEKLGFIDRAGETFGFMPDYLFPGLNSEIIATVISGVIGITVVFSFFLIVFYLFRFLNTKS